MVQPPCERAPASSIDNYPEHMNNSTRITRAQTQQCKGVPELHTARRHTFKSAPRNTALMSVGEVYAKTPHLRHLMLSSTLQNWLSWMLSTSSQMDANV